MLCHRPRWGADCDTSCDAAKGIEARGIGILNAPMCDETQVCYVLDLERAPASRYPDPQSIEISGVHIPVISKTGLDGFAHSLYLLLKYGQINDL